MKSLLPNLFIVAVIACALAACDVAAPASPTTAPPLPSASTPNQSYPGPAVATVVAPPPTSAPATTVVATKPAPTPAPTQPAVASPTSPSPLPSPSPIVLKPSSARVILGKAYPFELYTHCGIDFSVDFDASFWDATSQPPAVIGNPLQKGTMTLIDANTARFTYDKGTINYKRHVGVKTVARLCL